MQPNANLIMKWSVDASGKLTARWVSDALVEVAVAPAKGRERVDTKAALPLAS